MQKKYIPNLAAGQEELAFIEAQEEILNFSKLQILAYDMHKILSSSSFLELQLVGHITGEYTDEGLYPGFYFDARTETEGFSAVQDIYDYSDEMEVYQSRVQYGVKGVWKPLNELNQVVNNFVSQHPSLEDYVYSRFSSITFKPELEDIISALLTPKNFVEWQILKEQYDLGAKVPDKAVENSNDKVSIANKKKPKKL